MAYHQGRLVALISHQSVRAVYHHTFRCVSKMLSQWWYAIPCGMDYIQCFALISTQENRPCVRIMNCNKVFRLLNGLFNGKFQISAIYCKNSCSVGFFIIILWICVTFWSDSKCFCVSITVSSEYDFIAFTKTSEYSFNDFLVSIIFLLECIYYIGYVFSIKICYIFSESSFADSINGSNRIILIGVIIKNKFIIKLAFFSLN